MESTEHEHCNEVQAHGHLFMYLLSKKDEPHLLQVNGVFHHLPRFFQEVFLIVRQTVRAALLALGLSARRRGNLFRARWNSCYLRVRHRATTLTERCNPYSCARIVRSIAENLVL